MPVRVRIDFPTRCFLLSRTRIGYARATSSSLEVNVNAERAYWQHSGTGEVWAVETKDGRPTSCAGPFTPADALPILLPWLELSTRQLADVAIDWPLFFPREDSRVPSLPLTGTER